MCAVILLPQISDAWGSTSWLDHCIATHDGNDTFTYISDAWGSTSWLDHCIATHDGNNVINDITVCCNLATTNHIPVIIDMNVDSVPDVVPGTNSNTQPHLDWSRLDKGS